MKRGEIWTVSGGPDYARKPRPAVIVHDDAFSLLDSATICSLTTRRTDSDVFRPAVTPSATNGLREPCRLMVDKIATVAKTKLGEKVGVLTEEDIVRLNQALIVFLGLAISTSPDIRADPDPAS